MRIMTGLLVYSETILSDAKGRLTDMGGSIEQQQKKAPGGRQAAYRTGQHVSGA
jgi:hypothetical protein